MQPLIIIPARGGSKGIPHKNIKLLGKRPLIAYSIDVAKNVAALLSLSESHILLSTDDKEIAAVAESLGINVPYHRPAHLATDASGSREVMLDAMAFARLEGIEFDCILLLQPTSPFRTTEDVTGCLRLYESSDADMVVSVKEASANPYYNCFETDPTTGTLHISKGTGLITRRQDAPKAWEFNGAIYVINPASLLAMPMGAFPKRIPYEMPAIRSIDLDTPIDWIMAEAILAEMESGRNDQ